MKRYHHLHPVSRDRSQFARYMQVGLGCIVGLYVYYAALFWRHGPRQCIAHWQPLQPHHRPKIAMVTLADSSSESSRLQGRHFEGVLEATKSNKKQYCEQHGYTFIDASSLLDTLRPASWSKIRAVKHHLQQYEWIFWVDADTLITNSSKKLESLLPDKHHPDLILTKDPGGFNAGVWLLRNSAWSAKFLDTWWSMDGFIRRKPGDTKSGDNDALKVLLGSMSRQELQDHVGVLPQCACNSYMWKGSLRQWLRYIRDPWVVKSGLHRHGDFLLHLAGINEKMPHITQALEHINDVEPHMSSVQYLELAAVETA